jgi:hypothetical protein
VQAVARVGGRRRGDGLAHPLHRRGRGSGSAGWSSTAAPPGIARGAAPRKRRPRQGEADLKAFDRLRRQGFACAADARAALEALAKGLKPALIQEGRIVRQTTPGKKCRQAVVSQEAGPARYAVEGQLASRTDVHARQLGNRPRRRARA